MNVMGNLLAPDRDTIYTGVLLACGLPPKPRDFTANMTKQATKTTIVDYSKAHRDWVLLAEHVLYTALREYMLLRQTSKIDWGGAWEDEKEQFLCWISKMETTAKLQEEYDG